MQNKIVYLQLFLKNVYNVNNQRKRRRVNRQSTEKI